MCRVVCGEAWRIAGGGDGGGAVAASKWDDGRGLATPTAHFTRSTRDASSRRTFLELYPAAYHLPYTNQKNLFSDFFPLQRTVSSENITMSDYEDEMDVDAPVADTSITFGGDTKKGKRSAANLPIEAEDSLPWYGEGTTIPCAC